MYFECHIIDRGIAVMLWMTSQDKLVSNLSEKYLRKMYCFSMMVTFQPSR